MNLQLEKVSEQIRNFSESLAYNGLNLITQESIREIEFFLQSTSQLEAFRLATSLRYLHVELKRFLENNPAFNIERYVFFLTNCWLQSRGFISYVKTEKDDIEFYERLKGTTSETKVLSKLILQLVGVEKVLLEGVMMGLVFYFISLFGKTRGSILKWNLMSAYQKGVNPDLFLQRALPHSQPSCAVNKILSSYIEAENIPCAIKEENIFLEQNQNSVVLVNKAPEDIFSILKINKFYLSSKEIYKRITKDYEVTPFDLPANFLDYLYIKQVEITEFYKEGGDKTKSLVHVYKISHKKDYPLFIRIPEKNVNMKLIEIFNEFAEKKKKLDGLFCKLILERGQLGLYPLSIIEKNQFKFPTISEVQNLDNREFLKRMYKIKK